VGLSSRNDEKMLEMVEMCDEMAWRRHELTDLHVTLRLGHLARIPGPFSVRTPTRSTR
jgi:hypothetical protein